MPAPSSSKRVKRSASSLFRDENLSFESSTAAAKSSSSSKLTKSLKRPAPPSRDSDPLSDDDLPDSDLDEKSNARPDSDEEEEELPETADERRLRLGREYIKSLEDKLRSEDGGEDSDGLEDVLGERLQEDYLKRRRIVQMRAAAGLKTLDAQTFTTSVIRSQTSPVVSLALSDDEVHAFTGSKDSALVQYDMTQQRRIRTLKGAETGDKDGKSAHSGTILSLAVSESGHYLASGDTNSLLKIWDLRVPDQLACIQTWTQHRDAISGLAFRLGTHELYSASYDRTVKVWNLDQMTYVETLFGHQAEINCLDAMERPRALTVGKDKTVRLWKIPEESQLLFRGPQASVDCCAMVNEDKFLTGSQEGSVQFWLTSKKKPAHNIANAHGGKWITSVAAQRWSDVAFSGSSNGHIQMYTIEQEGPNTNKLSRMHQLPVIGFVNSMVCSKKADFVVAAVGQEHRLGRWDKIQEARNGLHCIRFRKHS